MIVKQIMKNAFNPRHKHKNIDVYVIPNWRQKQQP